MGRVALLICLLLLILGGARAGEIQQLMKRCSASVVLISIGETDATGFLICREPPLIACAAHTAVLAKKPEDVIVRVNESGAPMQVKAVHMHPGYQEDKERKTAYGPDAAILHLQTIDAGLGSPFILAKPKSGDLRGIEVISLGFPAHATLSRGAERESPEATIRRGLVQRLVDYDALTNLPVEQRPIIEHDFVTEKGESGSPLINVSSREVVAIHVRSQRFLKKGTQEVVSIVPVAVRVDVLWELLEQAGFSAAVELTGK